LQARTEVDESDRAIDLLGFGEYAFDTHFVCSWRY
jgi:hypothetical protein